MATINPAITTSAVALVALPYFVTEKLHREAHEQPEAPWVTAMFFVSLLSLLLLEELI